MRSRHGLAERRVLKVDLFDAWSLFIEISLQRQSKNLNGYSHLVCHFVMACVTLVI